MKRRKVLATVGVLAAIALGSAIWLDFASDDTAVALRPGDAATVAIGKSVYADHCASCHGANREGQVNWRVRLPSGRLPAPPHDHTGHTWHHPDAQLFDITKRGPAAVVGGSYESDMPGFDGVLTDAEIIAVLSYIKSTWPEAVRRRHDMINAERR